MKPLPLQWRRARRRSIGVSDSCLLSPYVGMVEAGAGGRVDASLRARKGTYAVGFSPDSTRRALPRLKGSDPGRLTRRNLSVDAPPPIRACAGPRRRGLQRARKYLF